MNPLQIDIPVQIETERLILRSSKQSGDGPLVNRAICDSIHELKEWLPFAQEIPTVEETELGMMIFQLMVKG